MTPDPIIMATMKIRVGVIFGGRSGEHDVSVVSAASIFRHLDRSRYDLVPIRIARDGRWLLGTREPSALTAADVADENPAGGALQVAEPTSAVSGAVDVVFPVLHGPYGEDGTVQGLLELANVPYVGAGVLGSALGMDKAMAKAVFAAHGLPLAPHLKSGYLVSGASVAELADMAEIDPALIESVRRYNENAKAGSDPEFRKGENAYNRFYGDPDIKPNPCVAPLAQPPFYAVRVEIGDLGTYDGIATNGHAQVLDEHKRPIPGLYAAGNDALSIMGGNYPGPGITLGPAMTFGWIAGRHLAGQAP